MTAWTDHILSRFPVGVSRLWIASDPDNVLLDEKLIESLRSRGFQLLDFDDPIAFRAEYEGRYRPSWNDPSKAASDALILRHQLQDPNDLPWDYLVTGRQVRLSLAELLPNLSSNVVKCLPPRHLSALYDAYRLHAHQPLGETAAQDFILLHIFSISPVLIKRQEDMWRELLRIHYVHEQLPSELVERIVETLAASGRFPDCDIDALWSSRAAVVQALQDGWGAFVQSLGATLADGTVPAAHRCHIPFDHPDVRAFVDSMFLDGLLQPVPVTSTPSGFPMWAMLGLLLSDRSQLSLVENALEKLEMALPSIDAPYREWTAYAARYGEMMKRHYLMPQAMAATVEPRVNSLKKAADGQLFSWYARHAPSLPSLPIGSGPVVQSHIVRYLGNRRSAGANRVALIVFDGMAVDQWRQIKDHLAARRPQISCEEMLAFSWLPTLTSVCRQSIFSGLMPREFADSIDTTSREEFLWTRFWQDRDLRKHNVAFHKGMKRPEELARVLEIVSDARVLALGLVVDAIDGFIHGAMFGKRGVADQIRHWLDTGLVETLLTLLLDTGFEIYITSDHGNTDAVGIGRPPAAETSELRGERVRVYRSEPLRDQAAASVPGSDLVKLGALPEDFLPIFAKCGEAFCPAGEPIVSHGGPSVEEVLVPFVRIVYK